MARQTRQQRRQRRAQSAGTPPRRPPVAPRETDGFGEPAQPREPRPSREEPRAGFPGVRFFQEAVGELQKVEWPSQQQVVSGTAVVLVACLLVGVYLWGNDELWRYVVQHLLLR